MSVGSADFDPSDYDLDPPSGYHVLRWLSRFVHDEVRPVLVRRKQAALDGWADWLAFHTEQLRQSRDWRARQDEFLRQCAAAPEDQRGGERPANGFTWCDHWRDPADGTLVYIGCWMPPELSEDNRPPVDSPLPPPCHRDLLPAECWAALLAVHDVTRDPREKLGPADSPHFASLCDVAANLTEGHLQDLRAMLVRAKASTPMPEAAQPEGTTEPIEQTSLPARAIALMLDAQRAGRPIPQVRELAKMVGCHRSTLHRDPQFMAVRSVVTSGPLAIPRGSRTESGDIEAASDD